MTPNLAILQFHSVRDRGFRLWIPLFLLWIPALLLSPLLLLILFAFCLACRVGFWRCLRVFWGIVSSLPGTQVRVQAEGTRIRFELL